ncbi:MAG: HD domain-containing protein [Planctomycetes bacterium]|nr:HD domain-containing protein [Planctomycetota bacterium]
MKIQNNKKIAKAIAFAFDAHKGQLRKGGNEPYIMHPLRVFTTLVELGINDVDMLCAAVLHDTIEDCSISAENITENFGETTSNLVVALTDNKLLPRAERKMLTLEKMTAASSKAKLIKAADRFDNLQDAFPSVWNTEKKLQYLKESKLLIEALTKNLYDDIYSIFVKNLAPLIMAIIDKSEQAIHFERNEAHGNS